MLSVSVNKGPKVPDALTLLGAARYGRLKRMRVRACTDVEPKVWELLVHGKQGSAIRLSGTRTGEKVHARLQLLRRSGPFLHVRGACGAMRRSC